jgi:hypothetical protein
VADQNLSLRHVRRHCLECSGDNRKCAIWCPCDGLHSTRCELWPFRFGVQPDTFRQRYGDRLLTPENMPPATVNLDDLPGTVEEAATGEIAIEGYHQPAVRIQRPKRQLTSEQRQELTARLRLGRKRKQVEAA